MQEYAVGRFRLGVQYRDAQTDQGLSVHVFGPVAGKDEEILRFDCFDKEPHYHVGWSYRQVPFVRIEADDPFVYALERLAKDINPLLEEASADAMDASELATLAQVLPDVANEGKALSR